MELRSGIRPLRALLAALMVLCLAGPVAPMARAQSGGGDSGGPAAESFGSNGAGQQGAPTKPVYLPGFPPGWPYASPPNYPPAYPPSGDQFASKSTSDICRKSPQSYTCLYGHQAVLPAGPVDCVPDYANTDKPGLAPQMHFALGLSQNLRQCVADQATLQNLTLGILASKFKQVAAILLIAAAPGVIDGVIHPPGIASNPDPYLEGRQEGRLLCEWGLKVSPALLFCRSGGRTAPTPPPRPLSPQQVALSNLGWLGKINPTANTAHCGLAALAVDAVLAGRGLSPAPPTCEPGTNTLQLVDHFGRPFGAPASAAGVNNAIYHAGDGARGIVFANGAGGGHFFNIVNAAGDVMLLDGQTGRQMTWGAYQDMGFHEFSLLRTN